MSTADGQTGVPPTEVAREGPVGNGAASGGDPSEAPPEPARSAVAPMSSAMAAGWLLRTGAILAVVAAAVGVVVAPGVEGNAGDWIVKWVEWGSAGFAILTWLLLVALTFWGAVELIRAQPIPIVVRGAMLVGIGGVFVISVWGLRDSLLPRMAVLLAASASVTALAGAYASARAPHTRAIAGVLFAFAFASILRLAAWEVATVAGDHASTEVYKASRILVTIAVVLEAIGQLVAAAWLGTRSRLTGQLASSAALVLAFAVTWGVAQGVHAGAWVWQAVLHKALGDAAGIPSPYGLDAVATFLVPAAILLALVAALQPRQVVAVVTALAFVLLSRGSFDAPLRALCVVVASVWAALAGADERAMWRHLIDDRKRRAEVS